MKDAQFSGTSLKVDENPAKVSTVILWSSSGRRASSSWRRPEHHGQNVSKIYSLSTFYLENSVSYTL